MSEEYYGLPVQALENEHLHLECLVGAGPRIVRLSVTGNKGNLLAETPEACWNNAYGTYYLRGGHRLWHAPEAAPRSSVPDNKGLLIEPLHNNGVRLTQPVEAQTGIQKLLEIYLHPNRPAVILHHYLKNQGVWPVDLSAWAITQFQPHSVAVLPFDSLEQNRNTLRPDRFLALWPNTCWDDPRLCFQSDYLTVWAKPKESPLKIGTFSPRGWVGCFVNHTFFCKHFNSIPDRPHPDNGCNVEIYVNQQYLEIETLGPISQLNPGEATCHSEVWEVIPNVSPPVSMNDVLQQLYCLVPQLDPRNKEPLKDLH